MPAYPSPPPALVTVRRFCRSDLTRIDPGVFGQATVVAIVPVTDDVEWAVDCAWEVARAAAARGRRVALIDLSLERPALDRGSAGTVHEGIVDAFLYGVSLGRVAQPQEPKGLHYIGVGTRAADPTEIWANARWGRLTQGFTKEGALLMAFLPVSGVPSVSLEPQGVILLAREGFDTYEHHFPDLDPWLSGSQPVWIVEESAHAPVVAPAPRDPLVKPTAVRPEPERPVVEEPPPRTPPLVEEPAATPTPRSPKPRRPSGPRTVPPPAARRSFGGRRAARGNRRFFLGAAVVFIVLIAVMLGLPEVRARFETLVGMGGTSSAADSVVSAPPLGASVVDTAAVAPASSATDSSDMVASPNPVPALDSLFYSVQVAAFNTFERAMNHALDVGGDRLPPAVTPVRIGGDRLWYRVIVGAFRTSTEADSALQAFWSRGTVERGQGTVVRTPQAFDLGLRPTLDAATRDALGLRTRGLPAYVVSAPDGARVFVGAFQRPTQAAAAESLLTTAGVTASLVQRMGIRQ